MMAKLPSAVLILAAKSEGRCQLLARVSDDLVRKGIKAIDLIKVLAPIIEGTGGGKENSAQAGGKAPHRLPEALIKVRELL
jgi:alanyl-tRNA synthetase